MLHVSCYSHLEKKDKGQAAFRRFYALRAVGLAVELGWQLTRDKGWGLVGSADLCKVEVWGQLRVLTEGVWRKTKKCTLQLAAKDARLAHALLKKQCAMLGDLGLNTWLVDHNPEGSSRWLDLVGSFCPGRKNFGVQGRVWVELKVLSDRNFATDVAVHKGVLEKGLEAERRRDSSLQGVLLLVAEVGVGAAGQWATPQLSAALKFFSCESWQNAAGTLLKASRGRCKTAKPTVQAVLDSIRWEKTEPGGRRVGLVAQFLKALSLPHKNPGGRATTLNSLLAKAGATGTAYKTKVVGMPGRQPWVASEDSFRALYQCH